MNVRMFMTNGQEREGPRHDFDGLTKPSRPRIELWRARLSDLDALETLAAHHFDASLAHRQTVETVLQKNPNSIFLFKHGQDLQGFWAMLLLTPKGLEALLTGELDTAAPATALICSRVEKPAGIYVWAVLAKGLAAEGIRHVSCFLRQPLYSDANLYAKPASLAGAEIMRSTGFSPAADSSLWRYVRHANEAPGLTCAA